MPAARLRRRRPHFRCAGKDRMRCIEPPSSAWRPGVASTVRLLAGQRCRLRQRELASSFLASALEPCRPASRRRQWRFTGGPRMRPSLALACRLALALVAPAGLLAGPLKISTGPLAEDQAAMVLEFEIRGAPASRRIELTKLPEGESVPCQTIQSPAGARIVWLAPALAKGGEG